MSDQKCDVFYRVAFIRGNTVFEKLLSTVIAKVCNQFFFPGSGGRKLCQKLM